MASPVVQDFNKQPFKVCYHNHKALKIGEFKIYGGNASTPIVQDADIYVSLQHGSNSGLASDPWETELVQEVQYFINDGSCPKNPVRFKKMITWLCNQLQAGKKIHIGCIGGHGRTGLVLSAMVAEMLKEKDAIQYVRKNYCEKVVESKEQIDFLQKHYGVSHVKPTKSFTPVEYFKGQEYNSYTAQGSSFLPPSQRALVKESKETWQANYAVSVAPSKFSEGGADAIKPIKSKRNLWP